LENNYHLDPVDQWEVDRSLRKLIDKLTEKSSQSLWSEGEGLTLEQAIELARLDPEN
jgi:hypothetical protein